MCWQLKPLETLLLHWKLYHHSDYPSNSYKRVLAFNLMHLTSNCIISLNQLLCNQIGHLEYIYEICNVRLVLYFVFKKRGFSIQNEQLRFSLLYLNIWFVHVLRFRSLLYVFVMKCNFLNMFLYLIIECENGIYEDRCQTECIHCLNVTQCHLLNGTCSYGCKPGYRGPKCDRSKFSKAPCVLLVISNAMWNLCHTFG